MPWEGQFLTSASCPAPLSKVPVTGQWASHWVLLWHCGSQGEDVSCHSDPHGHSPQSSQRLPGVSHPCTGFWRNFTGGWRWRECSRLGLHHNSSFLKHFKGSDGSRFPLRRQQLPEFALLESKCPHWPFTSAVPWSTCPHADLLSQQKLMRGLMRDQ